MREHTRRMTDDELEEYWSDPEMSDFDLADVIDTALFRGKVADVLFEPVYFYAMPETYHGVSFMFDPPCGDFMEDFSEDHEDPFYDRSMPGDSARSALREVRRIAGA